MGLVFEASRSGACCSKVVCVVSSGLACVLHGGSMPWHAIQIALSYGGGHLLPWWDVCCDGVVWWGSG